MSLKELARRALATVPARDTQRDGERDMSNFAVPNDGAASGTTWDASAWRDYFEERSAIAEHDGGMTRAEAEAFALEALCRRMAG